VAMSIADPDKAYRHIAIQGHVVEVTETAATRHIDKMRKSIWAKTAILRTRGESASSSDSAGQGHVNG